MTRFVPAFRRRSLPPVFPRGEGTATRRLFKFEWKKVNLMSSIPPVKATTRPKSAGRNFVALSFLVNGQYFKDYHKILGTLGLDHVGVSFTQWIHIVE